MARKLILIVTTAPLSGPAETVHVEPADYVAQHPQMAEAVRRVMKSGTTECYADISGGSLYLARGVAA